MSLMESMIRRELRILSDNEDLMAAVRAVDWRPGMRARVLLELDVVEGGFSLARLQGLSYSVRVHGFEFRFRKPAEGLTP